MKTRTFFAATLLTAGVTHAQDAYRVVDLGPISPDTEFATSGGYGLNGHGHVVGYSTLGEIGSGSTLWLQSSAYGMAAGPHALGHLGFGGGRAVDINDAGQVAGYASTGVRDHAYRWDPAVGIVDLGTLGGLQSRAKAINSNGWVVGDSMLDQVTNHAFLHDGTQMYDLGSFGSRSKALDINDHGQVVGDSWYDTGDPWNPVIREFLWLPEPAYGLPAGLNDIDDWSAGPELSSNARAINERGQVVAWLSHFNENGQLSTPTGVWLPQPAYGLPQGWSNLGSANGGSATNFPNDINDRGMIVGRGAFRGAPDSPFVPLVASMWYQGQWYDLNEMISSEDQSDWFFEAAESVNEAGVITGWGWGYGWPRGFMLVPVDLEPCAADLEPTGDVGYGDLLTLLARWGTDDASADLDGSGLVDYDDMLALLAAWGPCVSTNTGACCFTLTGDCEQLSELTCTSFGGSWTNGAACASVECASPVAGDRIENPIWLDTLPYSGDGTTEGAHDLYDEMCNYPATAPDVVYAYRPATDEIVTISLCRGSEYDTKLFVYEDAHTLGAPYACDDDSCGYSSEIRDLALSAGHTYYFVVDGFGDEFGVYTLDVTVD